MKLIVGLGNPGEKYAKTRHNVGFMALDRFADEKGGKFSQAKKFSGISVEFDLAGQSVILLKPETFMNHSGRSVRLAADYYGIRTSDILAVHDELDLPFGTIRTRQGGSSGGHNGIKSLATHLNKESFSRIRIGIANRYANLQPAETFVLRPFGRLERRLLPDVLSLAVDCIDEFIDNRLTNGTRRLK